MAVVLPIHRHISFSSPTENNYENQCRNEEEETGKERIETNESSLFIYNEDETKIADNDSRQCRLPLEEDEKDVGNGERDVVMGFDGVDSSRDGGSCDNSDDKPNASPLTTSGQNDEGIINDLNTSGCNPCNNEKKEFTTSSVGNYWLMDKGVENENETPEIRDENRHESDSAVDDNSAFISSLMTVDIASTTNDKSNDRIESNESIVSDIIDSIIMDDMDQNKEDGMEVETDVTPKPEDSTSIASLAETKTEAPEAPSYGGLQNLGNTCYMASALQFLCALDSFPTELRSMIPPENNDTKDGSTGDSKLQSLRNELLDVMDRLGNGEMVRPDDLKRCIDSRTSLFLGYHQQDSHEFLTTLLDIIDEDYKIKPKPEEKTSMITTMANNEKENDNLSDDDGSDDGNVSNINEGSHESCDAINDNPGKELIDDVNNEQSSSSHEIETNELLSNNDENDFDSNDDDSDEKSLESAQKRQKVAEDERLDESEKESAALDARESESEPICTSPIQRSKSYSNFKFSDIESLLHDEDNSSTIARIATTASSSSVQVKTTARQDEPKCKLAGGRMSTSGVELTRFAEDGDIDENVCRTDASIDRATPQQQIVDEEHHDMEEEGESEETPFSPVSSNFTTKVRVCLTCESCKFRRSHIETYLHISLDISTGSSDDDDDGLDCPSSSSIEEGLRKFFAPEKRDIKCEKCFHTSALQTSEITQLPRNLLFHLKRFIVDVSPDYSSISYRKDQSAVAFDERMELEANTDGENNDALRHNRVHDDEEGGFRDFLSIDCSYVKGAAYEIRSVVNHIGSSASCGHYTADAKRFKRTPRKYDSSGEDDSDCYSSHEKENENGAPQNEEDSGNDRQWTRFNDSYVSNISSKEAVEDASKTAYMIMYELVH